MKKFLSNLLKLIRINTPFFIIINFVMNFFSNYKTKKKSLLIENDIYKNFTSFRKNQKWFCNNLFFLKSNLEQIHHIRNILEIGSYEGRSAIFFLEQFSDAKIFCVDTWGGSDEQQNLNTEIIEHNFDVNLIYYKNLNRMKKFKLNSNDFFIKNKNMFDLIYIDGDHSSNQVSLDINNAWKFLNNKGILILDDYLWWFYENLKMNPSTSINNFIIKNKREFQKMIIWKQVIIQKN
jgi:predicted O-methyltransferase YrrM